MRRSAASVVLAVLAAAGLAYDAYVHLHLADNYDGNGSTITQGALFRIEAVLAIVAGLVVLASDSRLAWALAGMVGIGGVAAVVLYRYVDVGAIGPIPNMYEAVWYGDKTRSALAEGGVGLVWLVREAIRYAEARFSAGSAAG
ncbi:MAG TPA: hypothetical protein VMZ11_02735 [Mycobacteriales bacterium]|nr:hypothetical protein [Mycobacteriales bacterium]